MGHLARPVPAHPALASQPAAQLRIMRYDDGNPRVRPSQVTIGPAVARKANDAVE
jgi:hypothetical protein